MESLEFRNFLRDAQLTQDAAAKLVHIHPSAVTRWIQRNDIPTWAEKAYRAMYPTIIKSEMRMSAHQRRQLGNLVTYIAEHHPDGRLEEGQTYIDARSDLWFVDASGNRFASTSAKVKAGHWSPIEAGVNRDPAYHLAKLDEIARSRGGRLEEGQTYVNHRSKLWFVAASGERFQMAPSNVKTGHWRRKPKTVRVKPPAIVRSLETLVTQLENGNYPKEQWQVIDVALMRARQASEAMATRFNQMAAGLPL